MQESVLVDQLMTYLALLGLIFFRYIIISGIFVFIFYIFRGTQYKSRRISVKLRKPKQTRKEIINSFWSSVIFAIGATFLIYVWKEGHTRMYDDPAAYGYIYLILSGLIVLLVHETYYYWLHRWMHHPKVYRIVHRMHHDSIATSPWTAFSFDPPETILQAIFLPIMVFLMPLHIIVVLILLIIMTVSATINHLDVEIYPKNFNKHPIGKWLIGATHHSLHHSEFVTNYGLYFTFWDKWMQTESKVFDKRFEEVTS